MDQRFFVGRTFQAKFKIDEATVARFAEFSGDMNPIHVDAAEARAYGHARPVAHGAILVAFISKMIGMNVPGPGAVWSSHAIDWLKPVFVGDEVEFSISIAKVSTAARMLELDIIAVNQKGDEVAKGKAGVKVTEKLSGNNVGRGSGRVALVTGGSRGIGAAVAARLAAEGLLVAVNYRSAKQEAEKVVAEIRACGGEAEIFAADITDPANVVAMVDEVTQALGPIDVMVHGATPPLVAVNAVNLTYADVERYLKTYVGGALAFVSKLHTGMAERKFGRFIFLGTTAMFGAPPTGMGAYVIAKEALGGLIKCLATELGPMGITSNMVSPGLTVTDLTADIPLRGKEVEARKSPMRRLATTQDTAGLVVYLAGEAAGYVNGVNIPVTGGPV